VFGVEIDDATGSCTEKLGIILNLAEPPAYWHLGIVDYYSAAAVKPDGTDRWQDAVEADDISINVINRTRLSRWGRVSGRPP